MELIVLGSVFVFVAILAWKRRGTGDGGTGGSNVEGGYNDDAGDDAGGDGGGGGDGD